MSVLLAVVSCFVKYAIVLYYGNISTRHGRTIQWDVDSYAHGFNYQTKNIRFPCVADKKLAYDIYQKEYLWNITVATHKSRLHK